MLQQSGRREERSSHRKESDIGNRTALHTCPSVSSHMASNTAQLRRPVRKQNSTPVDKNSNQVWVNLVDRRQKSSDLGSEELQRILHLKRVPDDGIRAF